MNSKVKQIILIATKLIPDRIYLKIMYKFVTGKKLNLDKPKSYNEKLQWLKLNDRQELYTQMVDKLEVRKFIAERVGEQYLVPLIGVWDSPDDIDFSTLPNQFVLKCTHDCDGVVICNNKNEFDIKKAKKKLSKALNRNFYYQGREWPYKNVKPRIICEKYLEDKDGGQLTDYKIFNFHGKPKLIQVDYDRYLGHKRQLFSPTWERLNVSFHFPSDTNKIMEKPVVLKQIIALAKILSEGFIHLRTDFFIVDSKIYIGEMTFYHGTGMGKWSPESFDEEMGEWINLKVE